MGKRLKKKVKSRSRAHKKWVGKKRATRKKRESKVGYGQRKRRKKNLNKKK
jgi:hypothetical protein